MRIPKDTSWIATFVSVIVIFVTILLAVGPPTGGGGPTGDALVLSTYVGHTLGMLLIGAVAAGIMWAGHRLFSAPYPTLRRDLLVVAFVALYLSLLGSGRLEENSLTAVMWVAIVSIALLICGQRFTRPDRETLKLTILGATVVAVPITAIAASFWVFDKSLAGGLALLVFGIALLLFLLLRRDSPDDRGDR